MNRRIAKTVLPLMIAASVLAGCGSNTTNSGDGAAGTASQATSARTPSSDPTGTETPGSALPQVDPNTASQGEIAAAFTAAGVSNADKWAKEVTEYGPYTQDTIAGTLTKELGKYGIDDATLNTILQVLHPQ